MNRRQDPRTPRRLSVRYWRHGQSTEYLGQTMDVSRGGLYLVTPHPFPSGTRLRVELSAPGGSGGAGFVAEAVVAHSHRIAPELRALGRSGMGLRFLGIEELLGEVVPELSRTGEIESPPVDNTYLVRFQSPERFLQALDTDVRFGGLFVPTRYPAAVGSEVQLAITPAPWEPVVSLDARVVHVVAPVGGGMGSAEAPNLLAGMGVQFLAGDAARATLNEVGERLRRQ